MSRLVAPRPDDRAYWRKALARLHPDAGGDEDLFVWATRVREEIEAEHTCATCPGRRVPSTSTEPQSERIPYDEQLAYIDDHIDLTMRAYSIGKREEEPYRSILLLLLDCVSEDHGRVSLRQSRGASYRQLAYAAHLARLTKDQRGRLYEVARSIPLSEQHAHHIITRLKKRIA